MIRFTCVAGDPVPLITNCGGSDSMPPPTRVPPPAQFAGGWNDPVFVLINGVYVFVPGMLDGAGADTGATPAEHNRLISATDCTSNNVSPCFRA
jgi:hypothetical protein